MKDQVRTIEVEGLRMEFGRWVDLDNSPELDGLCEVLLVSTRNQTTFPDDAPDDFVPENPGSDEATAKTLAAIDKREQFGDHYIGGSPFQNGERHQRPEAFDAYVRATGREPGDDAYVVWVNGVSPCTEIIVPTSALRALILEARRYWEDWDADPPPERARRALAPPAPRPEPAPLEELESGPYKPTEGDRIYFAELEPIAESFESADGSNLAIPGYIRAMNFGQMEPTALNPNLTGLAEHLRAWGYPALARFHDAVTELAAYYRSDERRRIVGEGPMPPVVGGPVSVDLFRLGQKHPPTTTLFAYVARAELLLKNMPEQPGVEENKEMVREDGVWTTMYWRKEDGKVPSLVRIS